MVFHDRAPVGEVSGEDVPIHATCELACVHEEVAVIHLEVLAEEVAFKPEVIHVVVRGLLEGVGEVDVLGGAGGPLQQTACQSVLPSPRET